MDSSDYVMRVVYITTIVTINIMKTFLTPDAMQLSSYFQHIIHNSSYISSSATHWSLSMQYFISNIPTSL